MAHGNGWRGCLVCVCFATAMAGMAFCLRACACSAVKPAHRPCARRRSRVPCCPRLLRRRRAVWLVCREARVCALLTRTLYATPPSFVGQVGRVQDILDVRLGHANLFAGRVPCPAVVFSILVSVDVSRCVSRLQLQKKRKSGRVLAWCAPQVRCGYMLTKFGEHLTLGSHLTKRSKAAAHTSRVVLPGQTHPQVRVWVHVSSIH